MKKIKIIISMILCFCMLGLCACGGGLKKGEYLFKAIGDPLIEKITEAVPNSIDIFPVGGPVGTTLEDPDLVQSFTDAFTKVKVGEKTEVPNGLATEISFYWDEGDGFSSGACVTVVADSVEVYDDNGELVYYKMEDCEELLSAIEELLREGPKPVEYEELFEYDGFKLSASGLNVQDVKAGMEFDAHNGTGKAYMFSLADVYVNGIGMNCYQGFMLDADTDMGFLVSLPTEAAAAFGIRRISEVRYKIALHEYDPETYEVKDLVYTSEEFTAVPASPAEADTKVSGEHKIADTDRYAAYAVMEDDSAFGSMYDTVFVYFENKSAEPFTVTCTGISCNGGEPAEHAAGDTVYSFSVQPENGCFAQLPLANYHLEGEIAVKDALESLDMQFLIDSENGSDTLNIGLSDLQ